MAKKMIATRDERKKFDNAVKEVMRQRKAVNALQNAARQARLLEKQEQRLTGAAAEQAAKEKLKHQAKLQELMKQQNHRELRRPTSGSATDGLNRGHPSHGSLGGLSNSQPNPGSRPGSSRNLGNRKRGGRSRGTMAASMTVGGSGGGTANANWVNAAELQQLRREHRPQDTERRRSSTGDVAERTPPVSAMPEYRRASDQPLRPHGNILKSSVTSKGSMLSSSLDTFGTPQQTPSSSMKMSASEGKQLASTTMSAIGGGDRRGRNSFSYSLNTANLGGIVNALLSAAEADGEEEGEDGKPRSQSMGSKLDSSRSIGDALVPMAFKYQPTGKRGSVVKEDVDGMKKEDINANGESKEEGIAPRRRSTISDVGDAEMTKEEGNGSHRRITTSEIEGVAAPSPKALSPIASGGNFELNLGDIKLEDLVPTRRISRDSSQKSDLSQHVDDILDKRQPSHASQSSVGEISAVKGSREASLSPPRGLSEVMELPGQEEGEGACPRTQFSVMKAQQKSQSGNTGQTQGTSSSSLISSERTFTDANVPASGSNQDSGNFEAIQEGKDEIDIGSSANEQISGDIFNAHAHDAAPPGFTAFKKKRSGRIKKIRQSIRKSLKGIGSDSGSLDGSGRESRTTVSAEKRDRVARHLQRKGSARSMASAYTSVSAITGNSNASEQSNASGTRWARFRLKRGAGLQKAMSTSNVAGDPDQYDRNNSTRSNISGMSEDSGGSAFSGRCTDFYRDGDHALAVHSLISSKSQSGRSIVTPLPTVEEPVEGEAKHDEDYHARRDSIMSDESEASFYRHPSHEHQLMHMRPSQLFPDSPGWQCDECEVETFDRNVWAYISTERNFVLCEKCFAENGFSVAG